MPTFDITIQGNKYHVEIPDPGATPLRVVVDGQSFDVEFSGAGMSERPTQSLAEAPRPASQPLALPPLPDLKVARPVTPSGAGGGYSITAPMPGTILSIDVKVGDAIKPGQVICGLEAMKMKNIIRSSSPGTVSEILASAGQTVAYGDVLVRLAIGG